MKKKFLLVLGLISIMSLGVNVLASERLTENIGISTESESDQIVLETEKDNVNAETESDISEKGMQEWGDIEKTPSKNPVIITPLVENTLVYGDEKIALYPTFEDNSAAFQELNNQASNLLSIISLKYDLGDLTEDNWKEFYDCAKEYIFDLDNGINDTDPEPNAILYFFDIFEGYINNNKIIENYNPLSRSVENVEVMLPYDRDNLDVYTPDIEPRGWSLTAARDWAKTFCEAPCSGTYGYFPKGDCTNFTSQIKHQGGFAQKYTGNRNTGWWHTQDGGINRYSNSWTVADTFVKYQGTAYVTSSFNDFTNTVKAGKIVAYDRGQNGSWEHCAFIYKVGKQRANYRNIKIAQHTSNYLAWVSSSVCNWETLSNCNFAIVSR